MGIVGRLHLSGFVAWAAWLFVHIFFLIGFRNRFVVLFTWTWAYLTWQRSARLILGYGREEPASSPLAGGGPRRRGRAEKERAAALVAKAADAPARQKRTSTPPVACTSCSVSPLRYWSTTR